MLTYTNDDIHKPEHLKVAHIASIFVMSPTYNIEFFKKQVHLPLREYVLTAKIKLVEIRLLNSDYTLTEIVD
jgi:AraC family transcriptional regulator